MILRLKSLQGWLERMAGKPFPFRFTQSVRFEWFQKLSKYPVERWILIAISLFCQKAKQVFLPHRLPLLVIVITLFGTGYFVLAHLGIVVCPVSLKNLHWLTVFILRFPFVFINWLIVSPLNILMQTGTVSWRLPIAIAVPFGLVMGSYLYWRTISKFLDRTDIRPFLIRYSVIVAAIYLFFLPSLIPFLQYQYANIFGLGVSKLYNTFIWEPFYLYWNEGILSWRSVVFTLVFLIAIGVPYYGFRCVLYASLRGELSRKMVQSLAVSALLFLYFFYKPVWFVLTILPGGLVLTYQYLLRLPPLVWECVYGIPCHFLYYSIVSWKLLVVPVLLLAMILGYLSKPFRRLAECTGFSEVTLYILFWTLLLVSCFSVIVWKMFLLLGLTLLVYDATVRDLGMPKIQIALTPERRNIAYGFIVGSLILFDIVIILVCVNTIYFHCGEFLYVFFCMPFADLTATGQPSWSLLGPVLVLLLYLIFIFWLFLMRYETKCTLSHRKPLHKMFPYGSLAVVLLFLNICCFIGLFTTDVEFPWTDARFWPWWAMILPVSLAIFSCSGFLLTRKTKSVVLLCLFLCIAVLPNLLEAAENRITLLEPAKFVSAKEAKEAVKNESQAGQGGFLADPKIVDCFAVMEYKYTGGRYEAEPIPFRLRLPLVIEPGTKYPLIVWFHGRGESGNDNQRQLAHLQLSMEFFAGSTQQDFFMLATQCPGDNNQWTRSLWKVGKGDAPMTIAAEIMEAVLQEYPVDENRISACGFSSGGTGAWEFGRISPRKLAALGSCSGNPVKEAKPEEYLGPAIWAFVNKGDAGVSSEDVIVFIEAINAGGGNAFLSLYNAAGHDSWTKAMREEKLIGWLLLQSLTKPGPPQGIICRPLTPAQQFTRFGLPVLIIVACIIPLFFGRRKEIK